MDARQQVAVVRAFNRSYTRTIGALDECYLGSELSLAEVRVLFEIRHRTAPSATDIGRDLGIDAGYLSRMLTSLIRRRLVSRAPSAEDRRRSILALTGDGRKAMRSLEARASAAVEHLLQSRGQGGTRRLVNAMQVIQSELDPSPPEAQEPIVLRTHHSGDMGWVVMTHGELYRREYGWDERFEALVARIVADFIDRFEPARERCWIAERGAERVGSVFLVKHPEQEGVAKLRLLLVDPSARGTGLGSRLVKECVGFARSAGYRSMVLWTNDVLTAARCIYEAAGFSLVESERHESYGKSLTAQTWQLDF